MGRVNLQQQMISSTVSVERHLACRFSRLLHRVDDEARS